MAKRWDTYGSQELGRVDTNEESLGACSDALLFFIVGHNKEKFFEFVGRSASTVCTCLRYLFPSKLGQVTGSNPHNVVRHWQPTFKHKEPHQLSSLSIVPCLFTMPVNDLAIYSRSQATGVLASSLFVGTHPAYNHD
jgi:hypothetical protein